MYFAAVGEKIFLLHAQFNKQTLPFVWKVLNKGLQNVKTLKRSLTFELGAEVLLRVPDLLLLLVLGERVVGAVAVLQRPFPARRLRAVLAARILRPEQTAACLVTQLRGFAS